MAGLKKLKPGYYWQMDDRAGLHLRNSSAEAPQSIRAVDMTRYLGAEIEVPIAELEYVGAGIFGEARPSAAARARWTGDAYKYAIYKTRQRDIVIMRTDGSGTYFYVLSNPGVYQAWRTLVDTLKPESIWDVCHNLTFAFNRGFQQGERKTAKAFLAKELKPRRKRGTIYCDVDGMTVSIPAPVAQ